MSTTLSGLYPTDPPSAADVELRLGKRQALPQKCGWINADPNLPAVCSAGSSCAVNIAYSVHYCCPGFPCTIPTACLNAAAAATACDSGCQSNPLILKCPAACYTRYWIQNPNLSGYGCAQAAFVETVYTTNSELIGQIAVVSTFSETIISSISTTSPSTTSPSTTSPSTTSISTTNLSTNSSSTSGPSPYGSSTPGLSTGAKIGVGVGVGVGACLILIVIALFVCRRRQLRQTVIAPDIHNQANYEKAELDPSKLLPQTHMRAELGQDSPITRKPAHAPDYPHEIGEDNSVSNQGLSELATDSSR